MTLIKISEKSRFGKEGNVDWSFIVDAPGCFGLMTVDDKGTCFTALPQMKHLNGMHWKEVKAYCDTMPGWAMRENRKVGI